MKYLEQFEESIKNPGIFWKKASNQLDWYLKPSKVLTKDDKNYGEWFVDGMLNMSYLCIDKHIKDGYGGQEAFIYDSPVTDKKEFISYYKLYDEVARLAGGLIDLGVKKGDTVIIYMPMIPQAVYAMLACARIGAIHSVVFGGFAARELAIRIDDCKPKAIITASYGIEVKKTIEYKPLVDQAVHEAKHKPNHVIIFDRKGVSFPKSVLDIDYETLVSGSPLATAVPVLSNHPLYVLYTSGTTGPPKGIVRDTGGYATALKYSMKNIYDVEPGETYWAASDIGWVVGHSYIVYGPLLNRNTSIIFEGKPVKTPDASTFWRVIKEHNVNVLFTAPTAIRAIKREDPTGSFIKKYDLSKLKYLFLAGERCDVTTLQWSMEHLNIPVIDHWWQTESGWPMLANMLGLEKSKIKAGSAAFPVCGYDIKIVDENGSPEASNKEGYVVAKLPLPPGNMLTLWEDPEKFNSAYLETFKGYYLSGDAGYIDDDGYVFITGRVDDIINVAGHRLSTSEMEEIVAQHPSVAECAVYGVHSDLKGQIPMAVVVLKAGVSKDHKEIKNEIIKRVREQIGAVASFKQVEIIERLPKTRSGKILRKLMRKMADNKPYRIPSTIDDPSIINELERILNPATVEV